MINNKTILFTKARPDSLIGKIVQFPLIRIILVVLFLAPVSLLNNLVAIYITEPLPEFWTDMLNNMLTILYFFLFIFMYRLYTKYIEKREAYELSRSKSVNEFGFGSSVGMGLVTIVVVILILFRFYRIGSFNSWITIVNALCIFGIGAFIQELVFHGILFRIFEEYVGSWLAMFMIALIFGLFHIGNQNMTTFTLISLIAGNFLLTGAFISTRRIWLVWGIHFGWNFFQDGIFGMPNSGITSLPSWINPSISGPEWVTGGSFGIEASYIGIILNIIFAFLIIKRALDKDLFIKPVWNRKKGTMTGGGSL